MWRLYKPLRWAWGTVIAGILVTAISNLILYDQRLDHLYNLFEEHSYKILFAFFLLLGMTVWAFKSYQNEAPSPQPPEPIPIDQANRNRKGMINKVRAIWIEGRLNQSLYQKMIITLGLSDHPEVVEQPIDFLVQPPNQAERSRAPGTKIIDVYDEFGGELLILGAPGAGKTTLLLELTRDLLDRAIGDTTHPIPVVFPLSSWAEGQQQIEDWLVDELQRLYGVGSQLAKKWMAESQILPLLDGLDEMPEQCRKACIEHLNAFRQEHGLLPMVVSSRANAYEAIQEPMRLQGAVMIQPLSREQVEAYLVRAGSEMASVRQALRDDATLWEWDENTQSRLLDTPLMLNIVRLTYSGQSRLELPIHKTLEERRQHIFKAYVCQMFNRRGSISPYTPEQVVHWLTWLAWQMKRHSQTVFYIEGLRPDWLVKQEQQKLVRSNTIIIAAQFGGLVLGLCYGLLSGLYYGLASGIFIGLLSGLSYGLVLGLFSRIFIGLVKEPKPSEIIRWSWLGFISSLSVVLGVVLGVVLVGVMFGVLFFTLNSDVILDIILRFGLVFGLVGMLLFALIGGLNTEVLETRTVPNEGIRRSFQNALYSVLIIGLIFGLVGGLSIGLFFGLVIGLFFGLVGGLVKGGLFCIQHFVLRQILARNDFAPWNYADFLDYADKRILLHKVSGGYTFIHRYLLEYFANLDIQNASFGQNK